jgi:hypothetical protein
MERQIVQSSNVRSIGYDYNTLILEIEFNNGRIYQYFNVPLEVYNSLMSASSIGKFLNSKIMGIYQYTEI